MTIMAIIKARVPKHHRLKRKPTGENEMKVKAINSLSALILAAGSILIATSAQATLIDLTTDPNATGTIDGAIFTATQQQPAGTGFIDPFLRIQEKDFEQGYNTDGGFPFDDKDPHQYQHSLLISSLTPTTLNGTQYYVFMLDSNQTGNSFSSHTISLDALQLYTSNNPSQTTITFNANGTLNLGTLVYNLDLSGNNAVKATALGSGKADLFAYIPVSAITTTDQYLYLYSAFGNTIPSSAGFEEWTFLPGLAVVPEASTLFPIVGLLAAVLSTHALRRRQVARQSKPIA
jgi:hypothetical protein